MKHYLYKITNTFTNEYYLGVRSTSKDPQKDPYMGSSTVWTKEYIKEHRSELVKEILDESFETRKQANDAEAELIAKHISDPLCINISIPGEDFTQYGHKCPEWKKRLYSKMFKGEGNPFYGKHHTEESKELMRQTIGDSRQGEKNAFYGKHHSEEAIQKNKEAHTGINNTVSKPVKCKNLETQEVKYYGSLNLLVKEISGTWPALKKQMDKGRPYKKIYLAEFISKEEYMSATNQDI